MFTFALRNIALRLYGWDFRCYKAALDGVHIVIKSQSRIVIKCLIGYDRR